MKGKRLLREFIRLSFGLDRQVSMNALSDVVGGPDPVGTPAPPPPTTSYQLLHSPQDEAQVNVISRLGVSINDDVDEPDDELETTEEQS